MLFILVVCHTPEVNGQGMDRPVYSDPAGFSLFRDNYMITGAPTNGRIDRQTSDVVFQLSFRQLISRNFLGRGILFYATYTQTSFWDVYQVSCPMRDVNYKPGALFSKTVYGRNGRLAGKAEFIVDHSSNGLGGPTSRSLNRISLGYLFPVGPTTTIKVKAWYHWAYGVGRRNYLNYTGIGNVNLYHEFKPGKAYARLTVSKGLNLDAKGMVRTRLYFNPLRKKMGNQYLMLEWYVGHAESLLEYEVFQSSIRVGYAIHMPEFVIRRK